jgi:small-conductance mechanosensitive channel
MASRSQTREEVSRLDDDLQILKIDRQVSRIEEEDLTRIKSRGEETPQSRRRFDPVDEFDITTQPVHERPKPYKSVENPSTGFARFCKRVNQSHYSVRWAMYIAPVSLILMIPLLIGRFLFRNLVVGGVYMWWFVIWLEIVWLTLWAGRLLAKCLPWPIGIVSSIFTNNNKKWRDMGKQLELPATLFFWWLAIEVSFLPTMKNHQRDYPYDHTAGWMNTMNRVLIAVFVGAILNFLEKIIIQFIAISFHLRTYADRIDVNKFQIGSLTKLYEYSKRQIDMDDSHFEDQRQSNDGVRTPGAVFVGAAKTGKQALSKFGDVAGKVAGDFTGKAVTSSTHPQQVVLTLLGSNSGSQVLARRLFRTLIDSRNHSEDEPEPVPGGALEASINSESLRPAFENNDEAEAAFTMFDKDMNGDITMEELQAVCVEIGRERKSITASLKDLDSVVAKLDDVFMFIVVVVVILAFISLISTSAAGVLTSAGSAVLALSWLFSATAQEFLQSVIFVFVKHPFDVGDRVTIYGNTGTMLKGDDYYVKEIALLYTEFKKMEGHIVQAPNSYLNTLFILNQRRSGVLAEAITISIKFGTTLPQIDKLRIQLLDFVKKQNRDFVPNILTELRDIVDVHSLSLNVIFFHKSNWQNEGLRLARRNKFFCALMVTLQEVGIEGPYMRFPGMRESFPMYLSNVATAGAGCGGNPDYPHGFPPEPTQSRHSQQIPDQSWDGFPQDHPSGAQLDGSADVARSDAPLYRPRDGSILRPRSRGESLANMSKRVDFSLGMQSYAAMGDLAGDVYEDRERGKSQIEIAEVSRERERSQASQTRARTSGETARSTGREDFIPSGLARRSTDNGGRRHSSIHRSRFFGRSVTSAEGDDMERGVAMADIPEESKNSPAIRTPSGIDPLTISPNAWRMGTDESSVHSTEKAPHLPQQDSGSGAIGNVTNVRPVGRSRTEDFGLRQYPTR